MKTVHVYSSNRPADLLRQAVELLAGPPPGADPLRPRWIVQPGRLWERDLRRRLADRGIAAGLAFGSLRLTLERALVRLCPGRKLMDEDALFWAVLGLLARHQGCLADLGLAEDSAPAAWLRINAADPSLAQVQLARLLTGILDDHATHRPMDVLGWLGPNSPPVSGDAAWIAALARRLWEAPDGPRPLALHMRALVAALQQLPAPPAPGFPAHMIAVLAGAQPALYLQALGAMALACPVHLLVLETCERGAADHVATWRDVRRRWKAAGREPSLKEYAEAQQWLVPGTLQAFWGDAGIKLQQQLVDVEEALRGLEIDMDETGAPAWDATANAGSSALAVLQGDIHLTRKARPPGDRVVVSGPEDSLLLLNATSPLRELEGARDAIRRLLERNHDLCPSDILMILADTGRHAPLLPAVFGSPGAAADDHGPDGLARIPWHLADRSLRTDSDTMAALQDLLRAMEDRITLPVLADLLAQPAVQARLGFRQAESSGLVDWLQRAGFRWGLDQRDRVAGAQPGLDDGMWTLDFALRRLAAGLAHPDAATDPVGGARGVTPLPAFEGLAAEPLAAFINWAGDLADARAGFQQARPLDAWLDWLQQWMPRLLATVGERDGQLVWLARITHGLAQGGRRLAMSAAPDPGPVFSAAAFGDLFTAAAAEFEQGLPLGQGQGGVTVASPRMARVLPAKVIVVVGLSDGAWPRQDPTRARGLLATPRPGDRLRRDDDRLITLEWVLAAADALVWTWQGRDEHRGKDIPPAVVVDELLDVCQNTFRVPDPDTGQPDQPARSAWVVKLPMHAFDPALYDPARRPGRGKSFDVVAAAAAQSLARRLQDGAPPAADPGGWVALPVDEALWGLPGLLEFACAGSVPAAWSRDDWNSFAVRLARFWDLPCQAFLWQIGVEPAEEYASLPDREALVMDKRDAWGLRDQLLREFLGRSAPDLDRFRRRWQRAGRLPPGPAGDRLVDEQWQAAAGIWARAGGDVRPVRHLDAVDWSAPDDPVLVTASDAKGKYLLRASIVQWVLAVLHRRQVSLRLCGKSGDATFPAVAPDAAAAELRQLTALAILGASFPLPFFPATSARFYEKHSVDGAAEFYREGDSHDQAPAPEGDHPACRMAFRAEDPFEMRLPRPPGGPGAGDAWEQLVGAGGLASQLPLFAQLAQIVCGTLDGIALATAGGPGDRKKKSGAASAKEAMP